MLSRHTRRGKGDVEWYLPKGKRAIAFSSKSTKDLVDVLSEDGCNIQQLYEKIHYDVDAKNIIKLYLDAGYGEVEARTWFSLEYVLEMRRRKKEQTDEISI